jgi:hypothetical protein
MKLKFIFITEKRYLPLCAEIIVMVLDFNFA